MVTGTIRRRGALAAGAALAVALAGCATTPTASEGGELTIGMNAGLVETFQGYADAFMEEHDGWDISVEPVPDAESDYIQQLVTQSLSQTMPDIIFNYDTLNQTLAGNDLLFDIKPWLEEGKGGLEFGNFLPNFLANYEAGDAITGLPVSADSGVLFYNADVFAEYGVELPSPDWTLDDMYAAAAEITEASNGAVYGMITPLGDSTNYFTWYPVLSAFGGQLYDPEADEFVFANDASLAAWEALIRPYAEEFGTPYSARTEATTIFTSGQAAMFVSARPVVASFRESLAGISWDVQQLPTVDGNSTTGGGSYSLSIAESSPNKEAAWEFLSWFYSTDGGLPLAEANGVVPPTIDGIENGTWREDPNEVPSNLLAVTEYAVENAVLTEALPDDIQPKVAPALREALERVLLQGVSIEEAYTAAQDELNGLLK